jgi:putative nucleotidyltransferase with HDIG domain
VPDLRPSERDLLAHRSVAISRLSKLPPFHPTALQLLAVSTESEAAIGDYERIFQSDPALASHLLRVANSPMYGFQGQVDSIRHAITLMGTDGVRSLSFTIGMGSYVRGTMTTAAVRSVWNHSLVTAIIAEAIGAALGNNVPFLYTAGLLHDVGRLGLISTEGIRYTEVLTRKYFDLEESLLLEDLLFGCSHDDAGAFLARSWGFPQRLCDCIRYHHSVDVGEDSDPSDPLRQMVQLACHTAHELGIGEVHCANSNPVAVDTALAERIRNSPSMKPERLVARFDRVVDSLVNTGAHPEAQAERRYQALRKIS